MFACDKGEVFAVFMVGAQLPINEETGQILEYSYSKTWNTSGGQQHVLAKHNGTNDVILTLPGGMKTSDVAWISIWCRFYQLDMGRVMFDGSGKLTL